MKNEEIRLLQFFICRDFENQKQDGYQASLIQSNMLVPDFPYYFDQLLAVTCWRKNQRFHKEVIEYMTEDGKSLRTPHMDIEPAKGSVIFRWHKHPFPADFPIEKPMLLTIRVILDWKTHFETYLLIEKG